MSEQDLDRVARVLAQRALQTWNGGAGFGDSYFRTPSGLKVVAAVRQLLARCLAQETPGNWTCLCMWVNTLQDAVCVNCSRPR